MSKFKPDPSIFGKRSPDAAADMRARMGGESGELAVAEPSSDPKVGPATPPFGGTKAQPAPSSFNRFGLTVPPDHVLPYIDTAEDLETLTVGSVAHIALHLIGETNSNARVFYLASDIDKTATSMQKGGQLSIATGWIEGGKILLKDGQKRARSARAGGLPYLKIEIVPPPPRRQAYLESRKMNTERSDQTSLDDAIRWFELLKDGTFKDQSDLATEVELSVPTVSKTLAINDIPMRLLHRMKESPITSSLRVAYEISRIFSKDAKEIRPLDGDQAEIIGGEIIDEVIKKELSSTATKALIEAKFGEKKRRTRSEVREVRYGETRGQLKIASEKGTLDLSFRDLKPEQVEALTTLVETALAKGSQATI